jgi:hypothetical protein
VKNARLHPHVKNARLHPHVKTDRLWHAPSQEIDMKPVSEDHENSLRSALRYDPESGKLFWRDDWMPKICGGREAGTADKGYIRFEHRGRRFAAHRVIWFLVYGSWPEGEIDHVNGVGTDNKLENLRLATRAENNRNRTGRAKSAVNYKGVQLNRHGRFVVAVGRVHIGTFRCPTRAALEYDKAAKLHYGEFAHLNLMT